MSASGSREAGFGLDAELAKKQALKYDPAREAASLRWIGEVIGENVGNEPFGQTLKNGQLLVKLVNKIKAGSVKKMETSGMAFKQMENISNFLRACRALGMEGYDVFETVDLFEEKDLNVVVDCLFALSRTVQKKVPTFRGPFLGSTDTAPPLVSVFECTQATQSMSLKTTAAATYTPTATASAAATATATASASTTKAPPKPPAPPPKPPKSSSSVTPKPFTSAPPSVTNTASTATGSRGAGYGLDAALAKKQADKHDSSSEQEAIHWIEAVTGEAPLVPAGETIASALKSGEVLCLLVNKIKADSVKRVNVSKMPFKQMENISAFLKACRVLGVLEHDLFETVDLFDEKDMNTVVQCIFALGRTIQVTVPEFTGPTLGPRMAHENKRTFTPGQLTQARRDSGMTKLSAGSSGTMERSQVTTSGSGNITFGANLK